MIREAKHVVLAAWIRENILNQTFAAGTKIPSENELTKTQGVSRQTVRQAIATLHSEGLLEKIQGSGTYVKATATVMPQSVHRITGNIGVIITYLDDYVFPSIVQGIEKVITENKYSMSFGITYNKVENEANALKQMLRIGVDGLIIEGTKSALPNLNGPIFQEIRARKIPMVFINSCYDSKKDSYVVIDDIKAGEDICDVLIQNGHSKIGGIFKADDMQGRGRYQGFASKMFEHQYPISDEAVIWYTTEDMNYIFKSDMEKMILKRLEGCTAVICYNDMVAAKLFEIFSRNNLTVPDFISVISFDNSSFAKDSVYSLTSLMYPSYEIGRLAAEAIITKLKNPDRKIRHILTPKIKMRNSVKNLNID